MSFGRWLSKYNSSFENGWSKPKDIACKACLLHILKQLSTNCLYLLKVVPFKILSPPYSASLNKGCPINLKCALIWCVLQETLLEG